MEKYTAIRKRASKYAQILQQVLDFRADWEKKLKDYIVKTSTEVLKHADIDAKINIEEQYENLESIGISLGKHVSGISEVIDENTNRTIIKDRGSLMYSQLFNGKVQCWMTYPLIEGLMQPKQPMLIGIYAPSEFDEDLILSNFDTFFKELIEWENYDDDQPGQQNQVNRIGFGHSPTTDDE